MTVFDIATIRPAITGVRRQLGFYAYPGGKVVFGGSVRTLVHYAFGVQEFQVIGGPSWIGSDQYDLIALPQGYSEQAASKATVVSATPTPAQQTALQQLLAERFGLKIHIETREAPVYVLERGSGPLQLQDAADKTRDPRGGVLVRPNGIVDGEAMGRNITMSILARQLSPDLGRVVLDQTGLTGSYDFHLEADDPSNTDVISGILHTAQRLGLKLRATKGPVDTIVIDRISRPSEN